MGILVLTYGYHDDYDLVWHGEAECGYDGGEVEIQDDRDQGVDDEGELIEKARDESGNADGEIRYRFTAR